MSYFKTVKTDTIEVELKLSFPAATTFETSESYLMTYVQYGLTHQKNELQYSRFLYRSLAPIVDLTIKPNIKLDVVILISDSNEWGVIFENILALFKEVSLSENITLCKNYDVKLKKLKLDKIPVARIYVVYTTEKIYAVSKMCNSIVESNDIISCIEKLKHEKVDKQ